MKFQISANASVVAGPLGFYGNSYGVALGRCRDSKAEAQSDMSVAADLIDAGGVSAVAHAWRLIN